MFKDNRLRFDWDKQKEQSNIKKYGVSFSRAALIFYDYDALIIYDPEHSDDEERFVILGADNKAELLVAVFCLRDNDSLIRIISARYASKKESLTYFERKG